MRVHRHAFAFVGILTLSLAAFAPAHARWAHDASANNPVVSGPTPWTMVLSDVRSQCDNDGSGGMVAVWTDYRAGIPNADVYAQRVDGEGNLLWSGTGVPICTLPSNSTNPMIVGDGSGGAIVVWTDDRNGNLDLFAQRVSAAGVVQWFTNGVPIVATTGDQTQPAVMWDAIQTSLYVAWTDARAGGATDIYLQRLTGGGSVVYVTNGVALCSATGVQNAPTIVTNNAGGAIVCWVDGRTDAGDIYAQNMTLAGTQFWGVNGAPVCVTTGTQFGVALATDGESGMVATWTDLRAIPADVYAQRLVVGGAPEWTLNGVPVCTAANAQSSPSIARDGAGGVVIAWIDQRNATFDIYAQRLGLGDGASQWTANGIAACGELGEQQRPRVLPDSTGGSYVMWSDQRRIYPAAEVYAQRFTPSGSRLWTAGGVRVCGSNGSGSLPSFTSLGPRGLIALLSHGGSSSFGNIFAQKVDTWGYLGAEPRVVSVRDVPNDQGQRVKVSWDASPLDTDPLFWNVDNYSVFRSAPEAVVQAARARGSVTTSTRDVVEAPESARPLLARTNAEGVQQYWEILATIPALNLPSYSMVVATTGDSVGGSNPLTHFMVQAHAGQAFWDSNPDSGYSVDNLAPVAPAPFTGTYASGTALLQWNRNAESDVAGYRLYRGTAVGFTPSPANRVAATTDNVWMDAAGAPYVYKLTAVDVHGNESPWSTLIPAGVLDAPGATALAFLAPVAPNPLRGGAGTTLRFGLARAARATLHVLDLQGRVVRTLAGGEHSAGEHRVRFDGRDERGASLAPGLYLLRYETDGFVATRRLALIE